MDAQKLTRVEPTENPATLTESILIPVIEEQVLVTKRVIETGQVRLIKQVDEQSETVTTPLTQEDVVIEHVPIDQYVDHTPLPRQEGNTTIYPVLREVAVVVKRLLLVEEIRVTKRLTQTEDVQEVILRRESVTVEREAPTPERPA